MSLEIQILDTSFNKIGVLWNQFFDSDTVACQVSEEINGPDTLTLTTYNLSHAALLYNESQSRYVRVVGSPEGNRTYQITKPEMRREGENRYILIEGERIWIHLRDRYRYPSQRAFAGITLSSLLTHILSESDASPTFSIGTVDMPDDQVDFFETRAYDTALYLIREIARKMGREMKFSETTTGYVLDFPVSQGSDRGVRLEYGQNLTGVSRLVEKSDRVTRMYGVGGGDPPLTLSKSSLSDGNDYIDASTFDQDANFYTGRYENTSLEDWENLISAAKHPDLSGDYTAGLCAGWELIGTPTVSENTDEQFLEYGTKSQKVQASAGEGIQVQFTGVADVDLVRWSHIYIEALDTAATLRVELVDADGTTTHNDVAGSDSPAGSFSTITRLNAKYTSDALTMKIFVTGGNATFYVDAVLAAEGVEFAAFVVGSMADVLYRETEAELEKQSADTAGVTYTIASPDLFSVDPDRWSDLRIDIGDTVHVQDAELDISADLRVMKKTQNILDPLRNSYEVGFIRNTLETLLADNETRQIRRTTKVAVSSIAGPPGEPGTKLHLGVVPENQDAPTLSVGVSDGDAFVAIDDGARRDGRRWERVSGSWVYRGDLTPGSNLHYGVVPENQDAPTLTDGVSDRDIFLAVDDGERKDGRRWVRVSGAWVLQGDSTPEPGDDGAGSEDVYAAWPNEDLSDFHDNHKPLESATYNHPGTRTHGGITVEWMDRLDQVVLTNDKPFRIQISRGVAGIPADVESPYVDPTAQDPVLKDGWTEWGNPSIVGNKAEDGGAGRPGFSVLYPYGFLQTAGAIPDGQGEYKLRKKAGSASTGFQDFSDLRECKFIHLNAHLDIENLNLFNALTFMNEIFERVEIGTSLVLIASDERWISYRITSEILLAGFIEFGIEYLASEGDGIIGINELVQIGLSPGPAIKIAEGKKNKPVLSVTGVGDGSVILDWSGDEGDGLLQYREVGADDWIDHSDTSSPATVSGLTNGTEHEFQVQYIAEDNLLASDFSDIVTATPDNSVPEDPPAPTLSPVGTSILATVPRGENASQWEFQWTITDTPSVNFIQNLTSGFLSDPEFLITENPGFVDRRLRDDDYYVRARARNANGTSDWGPYAQIFFDCPLTPIVVGNIRNDPDGVLPDDGIAIRVRWDKPQIPAGDENILGYSLYWSTSGTFINDAEHTRMDVANINTHLLKNLIAGQTYYFWIRAFNACGPGQLSGRMSFVAPSAVVRVPGNPQNADASNITETTVRVTFEGPADLVNVDGYGVFLFRDSGGFVEASSLIPVNERLEWSFSNLDPGTDYHARVLAYNTSTTPATPSEMTTDVEFSTKARQAIMPTPATTPDMPNPTIPPTFSVKLPSEPALFGAEPGAMPGQVKTNWQAVTGESVTGYKLFYTVDGEAPVEIDVGNVTTYTLNSLPEGTFYTFWCVAVNPAGNGAPSDAATVQVKKEELPFGNPAFTGGTGDANGEIDLSWTEIEGATGYKIRRFSYEDFLINDFDVGPVTSYTFTGLAKGVLYGFTLIPYSRVGNGTESDLLAIKAGGGLVLKAPTSFRVKDLGSIYARVRWSYGTQTPGTAWRMWYSADQTFPENNRTELSGTNVESITEVLIENLMPNTTYYVRVWELDTTQIPVATSPPLNRSFTTGAPATTAPQNVYQLDFYQETDPDTGYVNIEFHPPRSGGQPEYYDFSYGIPGRKMVSGRIYSSLPIRSNFVISGPSFPATRDIIYTATVVSVNAAGRSSGVTISEVASHS